MDDRFEGKDIHFEQGQDIKRNRLGKRCRIYFLIAEKGRSTSSACSHKSYSTNQVNYYELFKIYIKK